MQENKTSQSALMFNAVKVLGNFSTLYVMSIMNFKKTLEVEMIEEC